MGKIKRKGEINEKANMDDGLHDRIIAHAGSGGHHHCGKV
jgi:hypothetical protein